MIVICANCHVRNVAALGELEIDCWLCQVPCSVNYPNNNLYGDQENQQSNNLRINPFKRLFSCKKL